MYVCMYVCMYKHTYYVIYGRVVCWRCRSFWVAFLVLYISMPYLFAKLSR